MAWPLAVAVLTYNLRRWLWSQVVIAVGTTLALMALVQLAPVDQMVVVGGRDVLLRSSWEVLGRSFTFMAADRPLLTFVFSAAAVFFLAAGVARAPAMFLPVGLAILPLLEATVFVQPFVYAALFLELIAAVAVFMLVDGEYSRSSGALRYLAFVSLGVPFILLAGWQLEVHQVSPDDTLPLIQATWMLGIGFMIIIAAAPFHSWVAMIARHSPPLAVAFVLSVVQAVVALFLMDTLAQFDWLRANTQFLMALRLSGMAMAAVGAAFVFAQRSLGGLMGYSALIDWGATLIALGLGTPDGVAVAATTIIVRVVALVVWGVGAGVLVGRLGDDYDNLSGRAWDYPFATAAVVAGGLSLAALPLLAGFPGRWALFSMLSVAHPGLAIGLIIAGLSSWLGYTRALHILFHLSETQKGRKYLSVLGEKPVTNGFVFVGILLLFWLGLVPQVLTPLALRMVENLAQLLV
jgi:NADH:ubiquinone oxidoreductase subunit 2 (subunit N)